MLSRKHTIALVTISPAVSWQSSIDHFYSQQYEADHMQKCPLFREIVKIEIAAVVRAGAAKLHQLVRRSGAGVASMRRITPRPDPGAPLARSVPHSEEPDRQYHLWRYSSGPALSKFGLVPQHMQTLDGLVFGIEPLAASV